MKGEEYRKVYNELVGLREIDIEKEEQRKENETSVPAASSTKKTRSALSPCLTLGILTKRV